MSILILGGNERMERQYSDLCKQYSCKAKILTKKSGSLRGIGAPDLIVLFTDTVSHKMLRSLEHETKGRNIKMARCARGSMAALRSVLEEHAV